MLFYIQHYYIKKQMSKLLINHNKNNIVFIDSRGIGSFQVQNRTQLPSVGTPILFKIMTNLKQITFTPSTGILMSEGERSQCSIRVDFRGGDMKEARIQIRWVALSSNQQLNPSLEQSVLVFAHTFRQICKKYKEEKLDMTLQSSNELNIQVVDNNSRVAERSKSIKEEQSEEQQASVLMKDQEGDVFYFVYLQSKGISEQTVSILKKNQIKSLKDLKRWSLDRLMKTQISLVDLIKLEQLSTK